jgi:hypothetical protein
MAPGNIAADIWAVVITACLLSVVLFFLLWAGASALTIARARRRARRRPELLAGLARGCAVSDLAEIDDALRQVLAQEHWRQPARAQRGS